MDPLTTLYMQKESVFTLKLQSTNVSILLSHKASFVMLLLTITLVFPRLTFKPLLSLKHSSQSPSIVTLITTTISYDSSFSMTYVANSVITSTTTIISYDSSFSMTYVANSVITSTTTIISYDSSFSMTYVANSVITSTTTIISYDSSFSMTYVANSVITSTTTAKKGDHIEPWYIPTLT